MAADCAAPPTASADQYANSNCELLLFVFPCKLSYINVGTFNLLTFSLHMIVLHFCCTDRCRCACAVGSGASMESL